MWTWTTCRTLSSVKNSDGLKLNPNNWAALQNLAIYIKNYKNDQHEAVKLFERVAELNPNDPTIYTTLGTNYKQLGMMDKAQAMHEKAVKINPNYEKGWNLLGLFYGIQSMYERAIPIFQMLVKTYPNNPKYRRSLELNQNGKMGKKDQTKGKDLLFSSFQNISKNKAKKQDKDLNEKGN